MSLSITTTGNLVSLQLPLSPYRSKHFSVMYRFNVVLVLSNCISPVDVIFKIQKHNCLRYIINKNTPVYSINVYDEACMGYFQTVSFTLKQDFIVKKLKKSELKRNFYFKI